MAVPQIAVSAKRVVMGDLVFLGMGVVGFVLMLVYARLCERL
jgi:hypothetical protein